MTTRFTLFTIREKVGTALETIPGLKVYGQGCGSGACDIAFDLDGYAYEITLVRTGKTPGYETKGDAR